MEQLTGYNEPSHIVSGGEWNDHRSRAIGYLGMELQAASTDIYLLTSRQTNNHISRSSPDFMPNFCSTGMNWM